MGEPTIESVASDHHRHTLATSSDEMEIEITESPELKVEDRTLLDMHALLNVLNVLRGELALIGLRLTGNTEQLTAGLKICDQMTAALKHPEQTLALVGEVAGYEAEIFQEIEPQVRQFPGHATDPELQESMANLRGVFKVLHRRAREIVARSAAPGQWLEMPITELRSDFREVFAAIEKNSHGRYRILYNLALQQANDYYIDFVVESADGRCVVMPLVFKDVMRDLIANARKYTRPGGTINVGLYETGKELRFVVQDTGLGIPPDEMTAVVQFGRRGSNVSHLRTMGGGFGLTKAVLVTRNHGGRFWIKSELGVGTRITLVIPRPPANPA